MSVGPATLLGKVVGVNNDDDDVVRVDRNGVE
jgi:hypothetical protein